MFVEWVTGRAGSPESVRKGEVTCLRSQSMRVWLLFQGLEETGKGTRWPGEGEHVAQS